MSNMRRFPFQYVKNMRDLGGYPIDSKHITAWKTFIRSDSITRLEAKEIAYLLEYGIKTIVDLRTPEEIEREPNPFATLECVSYFNISITSMPSHDILQTFGTLGDLYHFFMKDHHFIEQVLHCLADTDGVALFHCTAGKDRTGIIACLLYMLVGVAKEDILADYQMTDPYLADKRAREWSNYPSQYAHLLAAAPEQLAYFYDLILEEYQTIENFLSDLGVSTSVIECLQKKFIQRI